jgi:hypothetical protein
MESIKLFLRTKNVDDLVELNLSPVLYPEKLNKRTDILWESTGEYYLEAFQCGANPSICSIEKDPRILNQKEEIAMQILKEIKASI